MPSSAPTFVPETRYQHIWDKKRIRHGGLCGNRCSGHGICSENLNCQCDESSTGDVEWTRIDCCLRACPRDISWIGDFVGANDVHAVAECSNKGRCDRQTGLCQCFDGYDGFACQRTSCPMNCNDRGMCWPQKVLAMRAGSQYSTPWDSVAIAQAFVSVLQVILGASALISQLFYSMFCSVWEM